MRASGVPCAVGVCRSLSYYGRHRRLCLHLHLRHAAFSTLQRSTPMSCRSEHRCAASSACSRWLATCRAAHLKHSQRRAGTRASGTFSSMRIAARTTPPGEGTRTCTSCMWVHILRSVRVGRGCQSTARSVRLTARPLSGTHRAIGRCVRSGSPMCSSGSPRREHANLRCE